LKKGKIVNEIKKGNLCGCCRSNDDNYDFCFLRWLKQLYRRQHLKQRFKLKRKQHHCCYNRAEGCKGHAGYR
jgi:hypothetical protein